MRCDAYTGLNHMTSRTHSTLRAGRRALSLGTLLVITGCASPASVATPAGLDSIQSAVTCPAPPSGSAIAHPPQRFSTPPKSVIGRDTGYCAYLDTNRGVISIRLRPEHAPNAVNDFVFLARQGFYDGLHFYQVCPDPSSSACPAQAPIAVTGDPTASGAGGPGYTVRADPVVGDYLFGAVAMYGPASSTIGSQFFISKGDSVSLPRRYDIFGQVTDGIAALAGLQQGDTILWVAVESTAPEP